MTPSLWQSRPMPSRVTRAAVVCGYFALLAPAFTDTMPQLRELQADQTFALSNVIADAAWVNFQVSRMLTVPDGIWFMIQKPTPAGPQVAIVKTDFNGKRLLMIPFAVGDRLQGLTTTSTGLATIRSGPRRETLLLELDNQGKPIRQSSLACAGPRTLISLGGSPSTICPDGSISIHGRAATADRVSWVRPGTIPTILSDSRIAIVDQVSGKILLNDISTNSLTPISTRVPEVEAALAQNGQATTEQLKQPAPPNAVIGRSRVIVDTATDASGFYLLVWPYKMGVGPAVAKLTIAGQLVGRYRCLAPDTTSGFSKLQVQAGHIILGSANGRVYLYKP